VPRIDWRSASYGRLYSVSTISHQRNVAIRWCVISKLTLFDAVLLSFAVLFLLLLHALGALIVVMLQGSAFPRSHALYVAID
jgi:hypothetical protein